MKDTGTVGYSQVNRWVRGVAAALASLLVLSLAAGADAQALPLEGLRVLITNDDGVQPVAGSTGLFELRKALCSAGADVAVVAPWLNQSGASAAITYGSKETRFVLTTPEIREEYAADCQDAPSGGPVWGACVLPVGALGPCTADSTSLTPADAVTLGVTGAVGALLGWTEGPHVVLSGINSGGNDGLNVNIAGTLGAATIAASLGYPSIAFSASSSGDAANTYRAAAEWSISLVGALTERDLLPLGYVLSVNYPRTDKAPITEAVWATVAQRSPYATVYVQYPDESEFYFESTFGTCGDESAVCGYPLADSDSALYGSGHITISAIAVDRTVGTTVDFEAVKELVDSGALNPAGE